MSNNDTATNLASSNIRIKKGNEEDEMSICEPHDSLKEDSDNTNDVKSYSAMNGEVKHDKMVQQQNDDNDDDDEETENKIFFQSTADLKSERRLARALGYPDKWHVTRIVPHPASTSYSCTTFMDIIYCGDPSDTPDCYYNHNSALSRALEWTEGVSTGFEGRGGQMLPRRPLYEKDEMVEVFYEDIWYKSKIVQVKEYDDDVRYTVYYTGEDSTQSNVGEDDIRKRVVVKKKKEKTPKVKSPKVKTPKAAPAKPTVQVKSQVDTESALKLAQSFGLPEGWTAETRIGGKFYIQSPDKQHTFRSKKTAHDFIQKQERTMQKISSISKSKSNSNSKKSTSRTKNEHDIARSLGLPSAWKAKHEYSIISPDGTTFSSLKRALIAIQPKPSKKPKIELQSTPSKKKNKVQNDTPKVNQDDDDGGDPPWRRTGQELLGRHIKYNTQIGKVTGWIKETDVDSTGEAAFISIKTNKPGRLFHVKFKDGGDMLFADFEEWELLQLLGKDGKKKKKSRKSDQENVLHDSPDDSHSKSNGKSQSSYKSSQDSEDDDDDSIPLSKMKRKKIS